jgi:hypothetical protein
MNIVKIFLFLLCAIFLFSCASVPVDTDIVTDTNAVLQAKRALPLCTSDTSLYLKLAKLGEQPFGAGVESSKLAKEQKGLSLGFTRNPKTLAWSFLVTNNTQKTCFVAMGKNWRRTEEETRDKVFKGGIKQVGFSAPFAKMKEELLKEGKTQAGFDEEDIDLAGTNVLKKTIYLFTDNSGLFTAVTSLIYKNKNGAGAPYEISSIDAIGSYWVWASEKFYNNTTKW